MFADQPGDLVRDDRGLAAAGTGQHQQRAADVPHGGLLRRIETRHETRRIVSAPADRTRLISLPGCVALMLSERSGLGCLTVCRN